MKKRQKKEIQFNPADYNYLDDMPLEGWIWEIIRRSEKYMNSFNNFLRSQSDDDLSTVLSTGIMVTILQTEDAQN
jgi:hypothetical protein